MWHITTPIKDRFYNARWFIAYTRLFIRYSKDNGNLNNSIRCDRGLDNVLTLKMFANSLIIMIDLNQSNINDSFLCLKN